jgi:hypothetical protein
MSYSQYDPIYSQYGHAPVAGGNLPSPQPYDPAAQGGSIYANGTVQGPGGSMYGHSPTQGTNLLTQPNALGPQVMAGAAGPAIAPPMPQNQLMQQPPQLQPPAWQEEWQRVYDQMAQLGHEDPQTVAYQTIAKYGLGPYARQPFGGGGVGSEVGGGGGEVSGGGG